MNYLELYDKAMRDLDHDRISFDEFEKRIKPLKEEVRPTGHWIAVDHQRLIHRCSECGTEGYVNTCNHIPTWKYCPICGIRMEEPQESEGQA